MDTRSHPIAAIPEPGTAGLIDIALFGLTIDRCRRPDDSDRDGPSSFGGTKIADS